MLEVAAQPDIGDLPEIPVLDTGSDFPLATLITENARAHKLLDLATQHVPASALKALDAVSRRWLVKWKNKHLSEIDAVAKHLDRPGAYFLSVNYEWACTCRVLPSQAGETATLIRVLDWRTPGLGENVCAAKVKGKSGDYVVLTWPGYTGVLQVMAPGRFSIALNQAPMPSPVGLYLLDWAANRARTWRMPHQTSAHLLRSVCEQAETFAEAKSMLREEKIAVPAIYSLAGVTGNELAVVERMEEEAFVLEGPNVAANHWTRADWTGHHRGLDSPGRAKFLTKIVDFDSEFGWLDAPVLNPRTRLAMVADAGKGRLTACGYENGKKATKPLEIVMD